MIFCAALFDEPDDREYILNLYEKYYRLMRYQITQIAGSGDFADDLVQDAIIKLIPKVKLLRTLMEDQVMVYAVKTAKRIAIDYIRKSVARQSRDGFCYQEELSDNLPNGEDTPEEAYLKAEEQERLQNIFCHLPKRDQNLIYYRYRQELPTKELCGILNISPKSIHQCLSRARNRFANLWKRGQTDE